MKTMVQVAESHFAIDEAPAVEQISSSLSLCCCEASSLLAALKGSASARSKLTVLNLKIKRQEKQSLHVSHVCLFGLQR